MIGNDSEMCCALRLLIMRLLIGSNVSSYCADNFQIVVQVPIQKRYHTATEHTKDMAQEGHCWHPTKLLQEWFLQPTTAVGVIGFLFHLQWT